MVGSSPRIHRNGFLTFGDKADEGSLIKCGLYLGGQRKYAISEGSGSPVSKPVTGDPLRRFDLTVTVDLKTQTVTMIDGNQKLTLKLTRKISAITHAGYSGLRTTTAFNKIDITGK